MRRTVVRAFRERLARLRTETGFSLVEMMVVLSILAVGFLALATTASTGARMIAEARQRQAATEIANRELEHLRNVPFANVALASALAQSGDPDDPDHYVSADGAAYDVGWTGLSTEPLVIDAAGLVPHTEDITVGPTDLRIYRYVTWVDDPDVTGTQDYKRVVLIAYYRAPVNTGRPRHVRASALLTPGTVTVGGDTLDGTEGVDVPVSSPSPLPSGSCSGDTSGPTGSFTILSGTGAADGYTASETVTISLAPVDSCLPITVRFTNNLATYGDPVTYDPDNPTATWRLTDGDGSKSVWAKFEDGRGNIRIVGPSTINLDQTLPTTPGTLTKSASCSGANRTVNLSWSSSSDANLVGYRVYRSIDGGSWEVVKTTSALTASETHEKKFDSVRFRVLAYDKAGNEGPTTNEVVLAKNQCS